jgi:NAD(P)-dependent dehydrogenase (short-subunit alcohol dehydrogenase family)
MSTSTRVEVVVVIGAGSIGQAIARRIGVDKTILLGDVNEDAAAAAAEALQAAGSTRPPQPSMSPPMSPSEHSPIRPLLLVTSCMWCTQRDSLRRRPHPKQSSPSTWSAWRSSWKSSAAS